MRGRLVIRRLPMTTWLQPFVSRTGNCEPGHGWLYDGIIYRAAWRVGRIGFGFLWMPTARFNRMSQRDA